MGFRNVAAIVDAIDAGKSHYCAFRKVPSQATTAGWWADLSMAAGNPLPNYYASSPAVAATLDGFRGLFHGADKAPETKHLLELGLISPTAAFVGQFMLLDYLLYYPFIDGDDMDVQVMDNTTSLPRYANGAGVQVMAVAVAPTAGGGTFTFDYVNQDGVTRTSPVQGCSTTGATITSLVTSQQGVTGGNGPFLTLASGDSGVRSIVSVTNLVPNGGLTSLVLVKPLVDWSIREVNTASELSLLVQKPALPQIYDGAYLNFICNTSGSIAAGLLTGHLRFVWGG